MRSDPIQKLLLTADVLQSMSDFNVIPKHFLSIWVIFGYRQGVTLKLKDCISVSLKRHFLQVKAYGELGTVLFAVNLMATTGCKHHIPDSSWKSSFLATNYWRNINIHHSVSEWVEMEGRVSGMKRKR